MTLAMSDPVQGQIHMRFIQSTPIAKKLPPIIFIGLLGINLVINYEYSSLPTYNQIHHAANDLISSVKANNLYFTFPVAQINHQVLYMTFKPLQMRNYSLLLRFVIQIQWFHRQGLLQQLGLHEVHLIQAVRPNPNLVRWNAFERI